MAGCSTWSISDSISGCTAISAHRFSRDLSSVSTISSRWWLRVCARMRALCLPIRYGLCWRGWPAATRRTRRAPILRRRMDRAWLSGFDSLLATVRERLHRALGTSEEDPSELCRLLLAQSARVLVTATRLDVFFALDEHPVQIRLSGLDRDPGWVPAAGRSRGVSLRVIVASQTSEVTEDLGGR